MSIKRIISKRIQRDKPKSALKNFNIKEFYETRNKILIFRGVGGLGDILMHRMLFEDFKLQMPDAELHFACPSAYHKIVVDHPFVDKVLDSEEVKRNDYLAYFNTTSACGKYEMKMAPFSDLHRSDIWAQHCGINLTKHDMHFNLQPHETKLGKTIIERIRNKEGPTIAFCPISAMQGKNLLPWQVEGIAREFKNKDYFLFGLHKYPMIKLMDLGVPCLHNLKINEWLYVMSAVDYVISVDTASFHCAGGFGKPLTGIFTFVDGITYGKYFDFVLIQKHRNFDPNWTCGPCYNWGMCPKTKGFPKPCATELTIDMLMEGIDKMLKGDKKP